MLAYCVKRVIAGLVVLILLSMVVFVMLQAAPGSVESALLGGGIRSPEVEKAIEIKYHLNDSLFSQYLAWLGGVIHGDFGNSIIYREPVVDAIGGRLLVTAQLGMLSFGFAVALGLGLGVLAANRPRGVLDRSLVATSVVGTAVPTFVVGVLLVYVFSVSLGWFPVSGPGSSGADRLWHLILPALALGFSEYALVLKLARAGVLSNKEQDAFLFARARGVRGWLLVRRYELRTGLIPLLTSLALLLAYMLTGAVLVEVVFGIPGIGSMLVQAVQKKDIPVVQALTLLTGAIVLTLNLLADISYQIIDPRVRITESTP